MIQFTGKMSYSEESIYKLTEMQHRTFQSRQRFAMFILSVVLILIGFSYGVSSAIGVCAFFVGCILLTGINARPRKTAKMLISQINGSYPSMDYEFTDDSFSSTVENNRTKYASVLKLIDDGTYYYIYVNETKAYMIDKGSIVSVGTNDNFRDFISKKANLSWERPTTIMNMNIKKLRKNI